MSAVLPLLSWMLGDPDARRKRLKELTLVHPACDSFLCLALGTRVFRMVINKNYHHLDIRMLKMIGSHTGECTVVDQCMRLYVNESYLLAAEFRFAVSSVDIGGGMKLD